MPLHRGEFRLLGFSRHFLKKTLEVLFSIKHHSIDKIAGSVQLEFITFFTLFIDLKLQY